MTRGELLRLRGSLDYARDDVFFNLTPQRLCFLTASFCLIVQKYTVFSCTRLCLSTPTTLLSHYTRFILVFSKNLPQFLLLFLLLSSLFLSLTLLFLFSFFLFIVVIICYIYKFLLFFAFINSQHQLGDLSTTLEMTVLFLVVISTKRSAWRNPLRRSSITTQYSFLI